jgi:hypothetical protein
VRVFIPFFYYTNGIIRIRSTQFVLYELYTNCITNSYTVWFLYKFIQTNSYNCYTNCTVRIRTRCGFCTNSYNFYTNCIVRIHTRCDFFIFYKSVQTSCECIARAARAKPELQARSASRKRAARAVRAKPEKSPAPTKPHPAAPTIRVHPAAPTS